MYLSCLINLLLQLFLTNLAVSENNLDTRPIGERFANELSNIEGGNYEENNAPIGETKLDNEKNREHTEEDNSQSIGDRIAKRLEELGISQDDISSLPVLSRFQSNLIFSGHHACSQLSRLSSGKPGTQSAPM